MPRIGRIASSCERGTRDRRPYRSGQKNVDTRILSRFGRRKRAKDRSGAAVVEFAVIAPLLFLLLFGIIEFGRMIMVQQILTNASREGARRAIIEDATASEVHTLVKNYLDASSVNGASVTVSPSDLNVGFGEPVTVSVEVPFGSVSWTGSGWFLNGTSLKADTVMQGERLQ